MAQCVSHDGRLEPGLGSGVGVLEVTAPTPCRNHRARRLNPVLRWFQHHRHAGLEQAGTPTPYRDGDQFTRQGTLNQHDTTLPIAPKGHTTGHQVPHPQVKGCGLADVRVGVTTVGHGAEPTTRTSHPAPPIPCPQPGWPPRRRAIADQHPQAA